MNSQKDFLKFFTSGNVSYDDCDIDEDEINIKGFYLILDMILKRR